MNPEERISLNRCGITDTTLIPLPTSTVPQTPSSTPAGTAAFNNVVVIASSVVTGVVGSLGILVMVIVAALIVRCKEHQKTKQKLM